jgi:hypothetical protein
MNRTTSLLVILTIVFSFSLPLFGVERIQSALTTEFDTPVITLGNIADFDFYWPYHVALSQDSSGRSKAYLPQGLRGVFLSFSRDGKSVYIDFGRDGIHSVPLDNTDFIERTQQIREHHDLKTFPNLVTHFVGRLAFSDNGIPKAYQYDHDQPYERWMLIVADVESNAFAHAVSVISELPANDQVMICIFPQGELSDHGVAEVLGQFSCKSPFIVKTMRDAYSRTLLTDGLRAPVALVCTPNGKRIAVKALDQLSLDDVCAED